MFQFAWVDLTVTSEDKSANKYYTSAILESAVGLTPGFVLTTQSNKDQSYWKLRTIRTYVQFNSLAPGDVLDISKVYFSNSLYKLYRIVAWAQKLLSLKCMSKYLTDD